MDENLSCSTTMFDDDVLSDKNDDYYYRNAQGDEIIYVSQGSRL